MGALLCLRHRGWDRGCAAALGAPRPGLRLQGSLRSSAPHVQALHVAPASKPATLPGADGGVYRQEQETSYTCVTGNFNSARFPLPPQAARNGEEGQGEREAAPSAQLLLELRTTGGQRAAADVAQVAWAEAGGAFLLAAAAGGTLAVVSLQRCAPTTSGGRLHASTQSCTRLSRHSQVKPVTALACAAQRSGMQQHMCTPFLPAPHDGVAIPVPD